MVRAVKRSKKRCAFKIKDKTTVARTVYPVKYVPGLDQDLIFVTAEPSVGTVL